MTGSLEYFVTKSLGDLIKHDARRMHFVTDCVKRFERGDYGVVEQDELTDNATAIADGVGTVTGVYKAFFATGDFGNQVCISRDYEGNGEVNPIVAYLPLDR